MRSSISQGMNSSGQGPVLPPRQNRRDSGRQGGSGIIGEMHPDVLESYDIGTRVYAGSDFGLLMEGGRHRFLFTLPRYPSVNRDMALLVDMDVPAGTIERVIREAAETWWRI